MALLQKETHNFKEPTLTGQDPPAPMNHVKYLRAGPPEMPLRNLYNWYKSFPPDQRGLVEMKNPTRLSNKTSNA